MMKTEIPYDLIAKYLSGECNTGETELLEKWKNLNQTNEILFQEMKTTWQHVTPESYTPDVDAALKKVSGKIGKAKQTKIGGARLWLSIAAALIITISIVGILKSTILKTNVQIIQNLAGAAPKSIELPDGSVVILSSDSRIIFPEKFKKNNRIISFSGEAYFIITPDKSKPFIIESGATLTKVLGTEFNLRTYHADSIVKLTVTKGLVSFNYKENEKLKEVLVAAGEVGEINTKKGELTKFENTDPNFMSWKNGVLTFENQKLGTAIKTISEYYKVNFQLFPGLDTVKFAATFDSLSVDEAIETMQLLLSVDIALENGVYVLRQKS